MVGFCEATLSDCCGRLIARRSSSKVGQSGEISDPVVATVACVSRSGHVLAVDGVAWSRIAHASGRVSPRSICRLFHQIYFRIKVSMFLVYELPNYCSSNSFYTF